MSPSAAPLQARRPGYPCTGPAPFPYCVDYQKRGILRCETPKGQVRYNITRRSDREAEGARLLSEYAPQGHLGFESLLLRHFTCNALSRGRFLLLGAVQGFEPCEGGTVQWTVPGRAKRGLANSPQAKTRRIPTPPPLLLLALSIESVFHLWGGFRRGLEPCEGESPVGCFRPSNPKDAQAPASP